MRRGDQAGGGAGAAQRRERRRRRRGSLQPRVTALIVRNCTGVSLSRCTHRRSPPQGWGLALPPLRRPLPLAAWICGTEALLRLSGQSRRAGGACRRERGFLSLKSQPQHVARQPSRTRDGVNWRREPAIAQPASHSASRWPLSQVLPRSFFPSAPIIILRRAIRNRTASLSACNERCGSRGWSTAGLSAAAAVRLQHGLDQGYMSRRTICRLSQRSWSQPPDRRRYRCRLRATEFAAVAACAGPFHASRVDSVEPWLRPA